MRLTLEWGVASDAVMREGWKKGRGGRERESEVREGRKKEREGGL